MSGHKLKDVEEEEVWRHFVDGSLYVGTWKPLGMEGIGRFVPPYKNMFEGELRDNTFHGHGSAYWTSGQRMDGIWLHGECKNRRYIFKDGLIFHENDWKYCKFPDRRYYTCLLYGLRPAGATLRTNRQDAVLIPPMCYDSGTGIFDPRARYIESYRDSRKVQVRVCRVEVPVVVKALNIKGVGNTDRDVGAMDRESLSKRLDRTDWLSTRRRVAKSLYARYFFPCAITILERLL